MKSIRLWFLIFSLQGFSMSQAAAPQSFTSSITAHALRLVPGDDLKVKLEEYVRTRKLQAVTVLSAVGSVTEATIRYANENDTAKLKGHFEIVSLVGTLSSESGSHLHISLSDGSGKTVGGHLSEGSKVYTTAEIVLGELPKLNFARELDPKTTYKELSIRHGR